MARLPQWEGIADLKRFRVSRWRRSRAGKARAVPVVSFDVRYLMSWVDNAHSEKNKIQNGKVSEIK